MLIALKDLAIAHHDVKRGDTISVQTQALLPPGRLDSLKHHRFVEEITDEVAIARIVDELTARVEKVEKQNLQLKKMINDLSNRVSRQYEKRKHKWDFSLLGVQSVLLGI